jgi:hypothetical protein
VTYHTGKPNNSYQLLNLSLHTTSLRVLRFPSTQIGVEIGNHEPLMWIQRCLFPLYWILRKILLLVLSKGFKLFFKVGSNRSQADGKAACYLCHIWMGDFRYRSVTHCIQCKDDQARILWSFRSYWAQLRVPTSDREKNNFLDLSLFVPGHSDNLLAALAWSLWICD